MQTSDQEWRNHISVIETQFALLFSNADLFYNNLRKGLNVLREDSTTEQKVNLLKAANLIEPSIVTAMLAGQFGFIHGKYSSDIWDDLEKSDIIQNNFPQGLVIGARHCLNIQILAQHLNDGTFTNIFFGASELYHRYKASVVSIDIENEMGREYRGSGFLVGATYPLLGPATERPRVIVTCNHNVRDNKILSINTGDGKPIETRSIHYSDHHDIALISTHATPTDQVISLTGVAHVFDEVYTLGFPSIPRSHSTLLGHKGELNGIADRYMERDKVLIISNLVSPGSSGCPVLDRTGRCVGMTINWLEAKYDGEGEEDGVSARFSAAIPVSTIEKEIARAGLAW